MATAYHLEVLRRQRVIDRAAAARKRAEEKQLEGKVGEPKPGGSRNSSANSAKKSQESQHTTPNQSRASTAEANNSKHTTPDRSPAASPTSRHKTASQSRASTATGSKGSKPPSTAGSGKGSKPPSTAGSEKGSKPPSAASFKGSRTPSAAEESTPPSTGHSRGSVSREDSPHHEHCHSSARESHGQSRSSTAADSKEATSGKTLSHPTTPDLKAEAVRRDLHKQEVSLRDSNLVMGKVSTAEEMEGT